MRPESLAVGPFLIVPAVAAVVFLAVFSLHFVARRSRAEEERAKLFAMGYYLPRRPSRWPQAIFCTILGVGVPIATLQVLWAGPPGPAGAYLRWNGGPWIVGCIIAVTAIVGATVVAAVVFSRREPSAEAQKLTALDGKPTVGPEMLDFAGRIGHG